MWLSYWQFVTVSRVDNHFEFHVTLYLTWMVSIIVVMDTALGSSGSWWFDLVLFFCLIGNILKNGTFNFQSLQHSINNPLAPVNRIFASGLQAAATLRARDVHQRHVLVQGVHHSPRLGYQVQSGLQPLLVLQRSYRQGVPRTQPKAYCHCSRCESLSPFKKMFLWQTLSRLSV